MNTTITLEIDYSSFGEEHIEDNIHTSTITQEETWPELILKFVDLLNVAEFIIDRDVIERHLEIAKEENTKVLFDKLK